MCYADGLNEDIMAKAARGECPLGLFDRTDESVVEPASVDAERMADRGRSLWRELHCHTDADADAAYIAGFTERIPCGDCRGHWLKLIALRPPVFGESWFLWSVMIHNEVNAELGKPQMTMEEAQAIWA